VYLKLNLNVAVLLPCRVQCVLLSVIWHAYGWVHLIVWLHNPCYFKYTGRCEDGAYVITVSVYVIIQVCLALIKLPSTDTFDNWVPLMWRHTRPPGALFLYILRDVLRVRIITLLRYSVWAAAAAADMSVRRIIYYVCLWTVTVSV